MNQKVHNQMAEEAYQFVETRKNKNEKEFRSLARTFPSILQVNGLGGGIAFLFSKMDNHGNSYEALYNEINKWTEEKLEGVEKKQQKEGSQGRTQKGQKLMERITKLDSVSYRIYTNEVMNLCLWIKRFAEGMLEKENPAESNQEEEA